MRTGPPLGVLFHSMAILQIESAIIYLFLSMFTRLRQKCKHNGEVQILSEQPSESFCGPDPYYGIRRRNHFVEIARFRSGKIESHT